MSTVPLTETQGKIIGSLMGLLCLAIGAWALYMGLEGRTPEKSLSAREIPGFMAFGLLFIWGGIQTIVLAIGGNRLPRWAHVVMLSVFLVCLALPFILVGVLTPEQIQSSFSLGGMLLGESEGGGAGGIVFIVVGTLILLSIPLLVPAMIPEKKTRNNS